MSQEQINQLNKKLFSKDKELSQTEILVDLIKDLGCMADILGRDYEVYDRNEVMVYTIRQKPMKTIQLNMILKALQSLRKREKDSMPKVKGKR